MQFATDLYHNCKLQGNGRRHIRDFCHHSSGTRSVNKRLIRLSGMMSVCMSVTLLLQIAISFLFLDGIEPFFARQFSMWHSTKLFSSIFDLGPLTPKIYSSKFLLAQNHL